MKKSITKSGFTLVELAVVIVIIGVLAAFVVPHFRASIERAKAAEAFSYLSCVQTSQECYSAKWGTYADDINDLDIKFNAPKYFTVGAITADEASWSLALSRKSPSAGYDPYDVVFTENGFDSGASTIPSVISPI